MEYAVVQQHRREAGGHLDERSAIINEQSSIIMSSYHLVNRLHEINGRPVERVCGIHVHRDAPPVGRDEDSRVRRVP